MSLYLGGRRPGNPCVGIKLFYQEIDLEEGSGQPLLFLCQENCIDFPQNQQDWNSTEDLSF